MGVNAHCMLMLYAHTPAASSLATVRDGAARVGSDATVANSQSTTHGHPGGWFLEGDGQTVASLAAASQLCLHPRLYLYGRAT